MTIPYHVWENIFSQKHHSLWKPWGKRFLMMNMTTVAATCSTLPWIAFYFHQYSLQSIISNLFAVSWTSFCVMPMGLIALFSLLTPYSNSVFFLWGFTLKGLVGIAQTSAHYLKFLLFYCPLYSQWIFFAQVVCVFWWLIWQGSWRWWGIGGLCILKGIAWYWGYKPTILVTPDYIGVVQDESHTLWVTDTRKGKYVMAQWARVLNLSHISKENTLQDASLKALFEMGKKLKVQHPKAITFRYEGNQWIPGFLSDEQRPWRFQDQTQNKKCSEKRPQTTHQICPKNCQKSKKNHKRKTKYMI